MAEHRAKSLAALLPIAFATGYSEIEPDPEPLKVHIVPWNCERTSDILGRTLIPT